MANFILSDLEFILQQILISEAHAAGEDLSNLLPNSQVPWGLRTVLPAVAMRCSWDGTCRRDSMAHLQRR